MSSSSSSSSKRIAESSDESGILNERIIVLVFQFLKWDIHALCHTAAVNRRLRALAKRLLWRELCLYRAPRMVSTLTEGARNNRISGGWQALAKLMFFCGGCEGSAHFELGRAQPGHFVKATRFSKTSGRSFLLKKCRGDVLYVSDPCEHAAREQDDDIGVYRGVFREFMKSRTRELLIGRQVDLVAQTRCPYCGTRVWSMTEATMIPRKSAARRLGSTGDDTLEYFVCLNGHLHGSCWLVRLSSGEAESEEEEDEDKMSESEDELS